MKSQASFRESLEEKQATLAEVLLGLEEALDSPPEQGVGDGTRRLTACAKGLSTPTSARRWPSGSRGRRSSRWSPWPPGRSAYPPPSPSFPGSGIRSPRMEKKPSQPPRPVRLRSSAGTKLLL